MNLFNLSDVSMEFGDRVLFQNASFTIGDRDKIGVIGRNGTGKTTLFKILLGLQNPTGGEIFANKQTTVGYLEQHTNLTSDKTVLAEVLTVFEDVIAIEEELACLATSIQEGTGDLTQLIKRQQTLTEAFDRREGYTYKSRARSALLGLGFTEEELSMPFSYLSGGQKTRVSLCKLLLSGANLLLLDEPTNHLDLGAIQWLEGFLKEYKGAFCIISHDRYFLDKTTNRIFSLEHEKINIYSGNYSAYLIQKQEREKALLHKFENTQKEITRLEGIVAQQRQWNREKNIKTAESKLKAIERLKKDLVAPEKEGPAITFSLSAKAGGGQEVLKLENLSMGFGDTYLFKKGNLLVKKGDRIFLLGQNGCGKTTLFRLIKGDLLPKEGHIKLGANISVGFYDQTQSDLHLDKTVFDEVADAHPTLTNTEVRNALAAFLFRGDSVFSLIGDLSGGERARVSLVKLMLSNANFLLLDEPTNHLDIESRQALEEALMAYSGTLFIVSHDRYFINRLADSICYMEGTLTTYQGDYEYFLEKHTPQKEEEIKTKESTGKEAYLQKKKETQAARKRESDLKKTEEEIARIETEIARVEKDLLSAGADYEKAQALSEEADKLNETLLLLYETWETLSQ